MVDSFDEALDAILGQDDFDECLSNSPLSSNLINNYSSITSGLGSGPAEPPHKLQKPNNFSNFSTVNQSLETPDRPSSTPIILSFGNNNSPENQHEKTLNSDEEAVVSEILRAQGSLQADSEDRSKRVQNLKRSTRVRPPSQTYDHIVAERKRREQLSQRFVALSTIVPGLKKMDKTSVLGDAIKYLKHLQERVKILEEQAKKKTMESVVLVKKSEIITSTTTDEDEGGSFEEKRQSLPEIEARLCNTQILIRVHCENQKGLLVNLISQVEKLNLTILSTNVASFGTFALDITIITEVEKEFKLSVNELVKILREALPQLPTL